MKKLIPLEVSSNLVTIATDSPLEVSPFANATGVTTEKAPVLIAVRSRRTVGAEEFAERMRAVGGQGTSAQARLALNAVAAVTGELVEEYGAISVQTPFGTIQTFIAGTLENATDAPDPEANVAFLGVVVPEVYRRKFAQMAAYVPSDACAALLKRVRDVATSAGCICGAAPFYLEGRGMTIGGAGEKLELLDAVTREKLCDISVDAATKSEVQFVCELPEGLNLASGSYLVCLTTLAGGESRLWPVELRVGYVAVTPAPTKLIAITSCQRFEADEGEAAIDVEGENLDCVAGYDGEAKTLPADVAVNGESKGTVTLTYDESVGKWRGATAATTGDRIKVTLHPDPEKPDVIQEDAVDEGEVV